jgi:hypothetical protein
MIDFSAYFLQLLDKFGHFSSTNFSGPKIIFTVCFELFGHLATVVVGRY